MKTIPAILTLALATVLTSQGATISNPWSGVLGDRGNMSAFAFRADAGNYPASVDPLGSLTSVFTLDSLTLIRPNDTVTPVLATGINFLSSGDTPVYIDVYTSMPSPNTFSGYLGSSSSSVTWNSTLQDQAYSFAFSDITLEMSTKYWFVFSEDSLEGNVTNFRMKLNTSGTDGTAGPGQGYLVGDVAQALVQAGTTRDWAFAYTVGFTPVPEPSILALAGLGLALALLKRRGERG